MKSSIFILALITGVVLYADTNEEGRSALRNGALGKYIYSVVDDEGNPVHGAQAHVWFNSYGGPALLLYSRKLRCKSVAGTCPSACVHWMIWR